MTYLDKVKTEIKAAKKAGTRSKRALRRPRQRARK